MLKTIHINIIPSRILSVKCKFFIMGEDEKKKIDFVFKFNVEQQGKKKQ
jgi:hypothetical protein